tara:strand:- start:423 stop:632 length:210 start_codon:yes stop_codon:yes gene_type:complete
VVGRFFQSLQERIKTGRGQHVNFINQIDLKTAIGGQVLCVLQQLSGIVYAGPGGRINLNEINKTIFFDS